MEQNPLPRVLLVIPAHNEADNIVAVVEGMRQCCPDFDYIIVNDCSTDSTLALCREHGYTVLDLPTNLGLAGAVSTGMRYAYNNDYDIAIQFDSDGQHLPEYLAPLVTTISEGYDIVCASRFITEKKPFSLRGIGGSLISWAIKLTTGKRLTDPTSGMRAYNRTIIEEFVTQPNITPEPDTISYLIKHGAKVTEIPAAMNERTAGVSYLSPFKAMRYMVWMGLSILFIQFFRTR